MGGGLKSGAAFIALALTAAAVMYGLFIRTQDRAETAAAAAAVDGTAVPATAPRLVDAAPAAMAPAAVVQPPEAAPAIQEGLADPAVAPNYVGPGIQMYEAHWQGMDTRQFDQEIQKKLKYPPGIQGVLIGEVTMAAARSGLLAGDVIVAIDGNTVTSLEEFQRQTRQVKDKRQATISVLRKGKEKQAGHFVMSRRSFVLQSDDVLGFAQAEAAPMIVAGDPPPHAYRGPCTQCHAIGEGFELAPDPDLINLPPPIIAQAVVARGEHPHRDFGPCEACHVIVP